MPLSERQVDIVIGTLLGDGCLEANGRYVRLRTDHSAKQKEYVFWKFQEMHNLAANKPRFIEYYDKRTSKIYKHWRFDTVSTEIFVPFKNLFYTHGNKQIPLNIKELLLRPLSLAVWFIDDGYKRKDCKGAYFNTQAYFKQGQRLLQETLEKNFGITTRIHWARGRPKLYIPSSQFDAFQNLIKFEAIPCLKEKLF
jgi:hypothetical protein